MDRTVQSGKNWFGYSQAETGEMSEEKRADESVIATSSDNSTSKTSKVNSVDEPKSETLSVEDARKPKANVEVKPLDDFDATKSSEDPPASESSEDVDAPEKSQGAMSADTPEGTESAKDSSTKDQPENSKESDDRRKQIESKKIEASKSAPTEDEEQIAKESPPEQPAEPAAVEPAAAKLRELLKDSPEADERHRITREKHRITLTKMLRAEIPANAEESEAQPMAEALHSSAASNSIHNSSVNSASPSASGQQPSIAAEKLKPDWRIAQFGFNAPTPFMEFVSRHQLRLTAIALPLFIIAFCLCLVHEFDLDKSLDLVSAQYKQKDYDDALATIHRAMAAHPGDASMHFWQGRLLTKSKQFKEAASEFEKATSESPRNMTFLEYEAKGFLAAGRYLDAITAYDKLLAVATYKRGYNFANRGYAKLMTQQYEAALKDFDQAIALEPENRDYHCSRAFTYAGMKKYDNALEIWTFLIKRNAKDADAYAQRGQVHYQAKQLAEAKKDLAKSITVKPTSQAYFWQGLIDRDEKLPLLALANYEEAIKLDPTNASAIKEAALCYLALKDYRNTLKHLNTLAKIDQTTLIPNFLPLRAAVEMKLGLDSVAASDLEKIIKDRPLDKSIRIDHARCSIHTREYAQAYEDYSVLLQEDPTNVAWLVERGKISNLEKRYDLADNDFERAIQRDSNCVQAYLWRGIDSGEQGVYGQALVDIAHAMKLQPGNKLAIEYYEKYARLKSSHEIVTAPVRITMSGNAKEDGYKLMSVGKASQGISRFAKAVEQNPNDPVARQYLAYALLQTGDNSAAADQFGALEAMGKLAPADELKYVQALTSAEREQEAAAYLQSKLAKDPTDVELRVRLARTYSNLGWKDRAREVCHAGMRNYKSINDFKTIKSTLQNLEEGWRGSKGTEPPVDIGG